MIDVVLCLVFLYLSGLLALLNHFYTIRGYLLFICCLAGSVENPRVNELVDRLFPGGPVGAFDYIEKSPVQDGFGLLFVYFVLCRPSMASSHFAGYLLQSADFERFTTTTLR